MNYNLLNKEVQQFIATNLGTDVHCISLAKSPFQGIESSELATQIASKNKAKSKLPTWFNTEGIYYPPTLSIEQTSSEKTAIYKASLLPKGTVLDLTAGFGVDSYYFSNWAKQVFSCEINAELSEISNHNAKLLGATNITCLPVDSLEWLKTSKQKFDAIYIDPARRNSSGKVFKLADCTPNVVENLPLLFEKTDHIIIKTAPLLDLQAGMAELKNVAEIHIVSVKNECKELLWIFKKNCQETSVICATLNESDKKIPISLSPSEAIFADRLEKYLYEPDVALLKSGAFNWISAYYNLKKLAPQSHIYTSDSINPMFAGRIFQVKDLTNANELKKRKGLKANVIARNYPQKAEDLVKRYKITPGLKDFLIFTQIKNSQIIIEAEIIQYY